MIKRNLFGLIVVMFSLAACTDGLPLTETPDAPSVNESEDEVALPAEGDLPAVSSADDSENTDLPEDSNDNRLWCHDSSDKQHPQIGKITRDYEVDEADVLAWVCDGYNFGEIKQAYRIAEEAGLEVGEVFALREEGLGWGQVRAELGLKLDEVEESEEEEDNDEDSDDSQAESKWCANSEQRHPALGRLATSLDIGYDEIIVWFCDGYGIGQIKKAYEISEASGTSVEEIFGLHDEGFGWGEIEAKLGLKSTDTEEEEDSDS